MNRHAIKRLEQWKDSKGRKPMIIRGARQVGKTWLMKEFGRTRFAKTAYVNFENNDRAKAIFEMDFGIARMILALSAELYCCSGFPSRCCHSPWDFVSGRESGFYGFISAELYGIFGGFG